MGDQRVLLYRSDGSTVPYTLKAHTYELRDDGVAVVHNAVPEKLHPLTTVSRTEFFILLEHMRRDPRVKVCLWTAQGDRSFCSGASISGSDEPEIPEDIAKEYATREMLPNMRNDNALIRETKAFWDFPKPIVGAINGMAVGGGANIALCFFDMVLCSEKARFKWPFVDIGFTPELGSSLVLPFVMGPARAKEVIFTADWVSAEKVREAGLVNAVLKPEELMPAALALASKLAAKPPAQLMLSKKLLNYQLRQKLDDTLRMENEVINKSVHEFGGKELFLKMAMSTGGKKKNKSKL